MAELLIVVLCTTGVLVYAIASGNRRAELRNQREDRRDEAVEHLIEVMVEMTRDDMEVVSGTVDKLLAALVDPITAPPAPTPVHEQEVYGQAQEAIREFHDGFGGDVVDTPDWTDPIFPDARGDEPRVASVRPGDSVIPGQGNWEQMMNEGRAVQGDEMVSGEEQWEGERYE